MSQCPFCRKPTLVAGPGNLAFCTDAACQLSRMSERPPEPAPSTPSPYEQGFRDGLLTARAALEPIVAQERGLDGEAEWTVLQCAEELDKLIDQKNLDLWNLLALAQVDLSHHPEAEGLRAMLRAPSGLLINSEGQVLFIRIKGTEYDTGVLALRGEVERLKAAGGGIAEVGKDPGLPA